MLNAIVIGASGYTGAELARMINQHSNLKLAGLYVSANSTDAGKKISELYGQLLTRIDLILAPLKDTQNIAQEADIVFLATAHEVSHDLVPIFLENNCLVFDLSGAYRLQSKQMYLDFYQFKHQHLDLASKAAYGLAEWNQNSIKEADLIAVPGCYPTASQLAIKPLIHHSLLDQNQLPVINAVSGVTGAGRKPSLGNSFCEVSLQAYGIFNHRHQPEISSHLEQEVIFTPHLGAFKRGILATITMKLSENVSIEQVEHSFVNAYQKSPFIRFSHQSPSIDSVEKTPYCDLFWQVKNQHIVVVSAIDNLLKGAASQAMQCLNIRLGFLESEGIL